MSFLKAVTKEIVFGFGFPMTRKELTRAKDSKFKYVYEDTLGRHWIADGPWDVLRVKAAFDMGGWYEA